MKNTRTPLVVANWKMNPQTLSVASSLLSAIQKRVSRIKGVEVVVAPPAVYLSEFGSKLKGKKIKLGAQDVFFEASGAYTGEVSMPMLRSVGVSHVIVGHSERRARGETNEEVYKDVMAVIKGGGTAIVCVGEKKRDTQGHYFEIVERQLRTALKGVPKTKVAQIVVAYEPIWAIGTGNTARPADAYEMSIFIQKVLSKLFGRSALSKIRVLYGGSVTKRNAEELMREGGVDGFLVGGASLHAAEFSDIAKSARIHGT